ncbi:tagaturonate reductase [Carboxylicivirga sp. A043]|uniref:tagaturonate reductase n=1 Tax=Carboxylicivirga litoralis TaxID=2816963 RepID=UPI0021CB91EF|nr:tagaturonate reductase [Carboxylicivirga sp. A043]MCU4157819.1 tagaturonate reductase [Carboxylicivirga sp. A043]
MKSLNRTTYNQAVNHQFKILQFGEGNFLRAFVDWMIHKSNKALGTNNGVVVVQPLAQGMVDLLNKQDNLYHVLLQGMKDGQAVQETELVDCIIDAVNPYTQYEAYKNYFLNPELELVVSNTTEAGISRIDDEDIFALPPKSFPGKVTQLLYQRFKHFDGAADKGLTFFCCELIEKNATILKEIVLELSVANQLEEAFINWVNTSCSFCNTLVDRIVPGFPKANIKEIQAELGYEDNLVVVGEYFHLWAIEAPQAVRDKYPFDKAGLNVVWLEDMTKFRDKKVRILNGSHTALVPVGLLSGHQTVKEAFDDKTLAAFINDMVAQEVIPNIDGDKDALKAFADEILERFFNPYIRHFLKDISLNSLSKWMTRDYPSLVDSLERNGQLPAKLSFSLAALLVLYRGQYNNLNFTINDTPEHVAFIQNEWSAMESYDALTSNILSNQSIWNTDLSSVNGLSAAVANYIEAIMEEGIETASKQVI